MEEGFKKINLNSIKKVFQEPKEQNNPFVNSTAKGLPGDVFSPLKSSFLTPLPQKRRGPRWLSFLFSGRRSSDESRKRQFVSNKKIILAGIILFLILFLLILIPLRNTYLHARQTYQTTKEVGNALKNQDIEEVKDKLFKMKKELQDTQKSFKFLAWMKLLPFLGSYVSDADHLLQAATFGIEAGEEAIEAILPYADLIGLKSGESFVSGSADERIETAVKTMDKLTPKISVIAEKLSNVKREIDFINSNRYPQKLSNLLIRNKIDTLKKDADELITLFEDATPLLEILPQLLGEPEPKKYLVLFQNDKELRPTGGFITAYAVFKVEHGKVTVLKSDDIYKLDEAQRKKKGAPPEIIKYHKGVYFANLRDSNLSPDFNLSMKNFEELYETVAGKEEVEGIIAVDTDVLVEAMKILGPIPAYGTNYTIDPDERCQGCPQVIYELERYADQPVAYERGSRKDIIGVLLYQIMQKALGVSPGQYWSRLFQMGLAELNEKHILVYFHDQKAQKAIEALNFGGRIAGGEDKIKTLGYEDEAGWDYFHINDTNFAGAKSNMFVKHFVNQSIEIKNDGTIIKTITIDYKNPAPPSDCGLEAGGLCLNGLLRNWTRVYVPKESKLLESNGSQSPETGKPEQMETDQDLGKTVFNGFILVRPQGQSRLTLKYQLPFKAGKQLPLFIQKQPGTEGHEYTVVANGQEIEKFNLQVDKVMTIKY